MQNNGVLRFLVFIGLIIFVNVLSYLFNWSFWVY